MTTKQQTDLRVILTQLMFIANGLGTTHTEADLMKHVSILEAWIDQQINLEISKAIQPFIKVEATNLPKRRDLK